MPLHLLQTGDKGASLLFTVRHVALPYVALPCLFYSLLPCLIRCLALLSLALSFLAFALLRLVLLCFGWSYFLMFLPSCVQSLFFCLVFLCFLGLFG
jgi:hypothetical protein